MGYSSGRRLPYQSTSFVAPNDCRWRRTPRVSIHRVPASGVSVQSTNGSFRVISEAQRRFHLYTSGEDKKAIHPNLRSAVFRTVVSNGGRPEYTAVQDEYLHTTSVDGKEICLYSLGRVQTADLVNDYLDFIFCPKVALQDKHSGAASLAANSKARVGLWQYVKLNWDKIHEQLAGNPVVLNRFLKMSLTTYASHEVARDIAEFFEGKDNRAYDRTLGIIADTIRGNANYKERDEQLVLEWLKAHGYV